MFVPLPQLSKILSPSLPTSIYALFSLSLALPLTLFLKIRKKIKKKANTKTKKKQKVHKKQNMELSPLCSGLSLLGMGLPRVCVVDMHSDTHWRELVLPFPAGTTCT